MLTLKVSITRDDYIMLLEKTCFHKPDRKSSSQIDLLEILREFFFQQCNDHSPITFIAYGRNNVFFYYALAIAAIIFCHGDAKKILIAFQWSTFRPFVSPTNGYGGS